MATVVTMIQGRRTARPLPGPLEDVAVYHDLRAAEAPAPDETVAALASGATPVPDRVWADLDMDAVFDRVDRCASAVGQQVLYRLLRCPATEPEEIAERDAVIRRLGEHPELRRHIERALRGLRGRGAYDLSRLFLDDLPPRPRSYLLFPALTAAAVACIALTFFHPAAWLGLIAIAFINVGVQAYYRPAVQHLIGPIGALRALLLAARRLGSIDDPVLRPYATELREQAERLRRIDRFARHLLREAVGNELLEMATAYANLVFLLDVNAFVFSIDLIRRRRDALRRVFETAGMLDAMRSAALFRRELPEWCVPEFTAPRNEIVAKAVYHPLLDDPVANDVEVRGKGLLITGSNMAGKTTYLRAVAVCALLARAIATCPARRWSAPPLAIATLIARKDDLLGGRSYFLVEVELVRELLARAGSGVQHLFLIDEIFRGTNTRERIAASKAVLEHLDRGDHICLVSTHDVELIDLLGSNWEFRHFRETVEAGGVRFDYRIRSGASSAPNALRLLAVSDYPTDVVEDAYRAYTLLGRGEA